MESFVSLQFYKETLSTENGESSGKTDGEASEDVEMKEEGKNTICTVSLSK